MNPDMQKYTWHKNNPTPVFCRLDYFLASFNLYGNIKKMEIKASYKSDHSIILTEILLNNHRRGRGFWKLNCSLLEDKNYVEKIKTTIKSAVEENSGADPQLLWDTVKCRIRGTSIAYATFKKKQEDNTLLELEFQLDKYAKKYESKSDPEILSKIENIKSDINNIMQRKAHGAAIRSRTRYFEYGEKNSKYFLNMEKRNSNKHNITKLQIGDKVVIDPDIILQEQSNFYKHLYTGNSKNVCDYGIEKEFFESNQPKLSEIDAQYCDSDITMQEIYDILQTFPDNKAPGTDGFPGEFYKKFWPDIKNLLFNCYNYSLTSNQMSISQRQGIISLIPKKGKNLTLLKNWTPITLLNFDYKLLTKCIAYRIKTVLPTIINKDQTGFLPGRYIGENLIRIQEILHYAKVNNVDSYLVTVDYEKAFDFLEWGHIIKCLKHFNFGSKIIDWIKIIYKNVNSCSINNGHFSEFFRLSRGVRQGCPLSPYLFILCVEPLAHKIRNTNEIKGIKIDNLEHKISQYADDTTLFLKGELSSFSLTFKLLDSYSTISGLKVNKEKTQVLALNPLQERKEFIQLSGFNSTSGPVSILGVDLFPEYRKNYYI